MFEEILQELNESAQRLDELSYSEILRKSRSVNKLFPPFDDRVKAVARKGGIRLVQQTLNAWHFDVKSATDPKWYRDTIEFVNLEHAIKQNVRNKRLWNTAKTNVDYRKLADTIMYSIDLKLDCQCPANLYWGPAFILTKRNAKAGRQEYRPPKIRNPKEYGAVCKHLKLVLNLFPNYASTFAKYLKDNFSKLIDTEVAKVNKEGSEIAKGAAFLKSKETEETDKIAKKVGIEPRTTIDKIEKGSEEETEDEEIGKTD